MPVQRTRAGLCHRTSGTGPDIVLVHGLGASHAFWFPKVARDLAREHRVTAYDLRGHGRSTMPVSGYDPTAMAGDLASLLDELGIAAAHLVGHSFGGLVALELAVTRPERVVSLVVADSRIPGGRGTGGGLDHRGLERIARGHGPRFGDQRPPFSPFGGFAAGRRSGQRFLTLLAETSAVQEIQRPWSIVPARLAALRVPLLAVYGQRSTALSSGKLLARAVPGGRLVVLPRVGHFHPVADPSAFLGAVREFLGDATTCAAASA